MGDELHNTPLHGLCLVLALFLVPACDTGKDLGGDSTGADGTSGASTGATVR